MRQQEVEPSEAILKNNWFVKIYDTWKAKNFAILIDSIVQHSSTIFDVQHPILFTHVPCPADKSCIMLEYA